MKKKTTTTQYTYLYMRHGFVVHHIMETLFFPNYNFGILKITSEDILLIQQILYCIYYYSNSRKLFSRNCDILKQTSKICNQFNAINSMIVQLPCGILWATIFFTLCHVPWFYYNQLSSKCYYPTKQTSNTIVSQYIACNSTYCVKETSRTLCACVIVVVVVAIFQPCISSTNNVIFNVDTPSIANHYPEHRWWIICCYVL